MLRQVVSSFHHSIAGDQEFMASTGAESRGIIPDTYCYVRRAQAFFLEKVVDSVDQSKFSNIR
jgi:hypothetical protein